MTDKKTIAHPYINGFAFIACQRGASEFQVAEVLNYDRVVITARLIRDTNRQIGAVLAFPYHDRRGPGATLLGDVRSWWEDWKKLMNHLVGVSQVTLQEFRTDVDYWLKHIDSPEDTEGKRDGTSLV